MALTEAIFELLAEKDIPTAEEVKERVKRLQNQTKIWFRRLQ